MPSHPNTENPNNNRIDLSERDVLAQQIAVETPNLHYLQLFRYATKKDLIIIAISSLCAVIAGAITTLPALLTALLIGSIQERATSNPGQASASSELTRFIIYFMYLFVCELVTCYIATIGFIRTGIVLSSRIREQYLAALLRQNMAFFDNIGAGEIATHITADTNLIRDGISEKLSIALQCCSSVITAFVIGFIRDWRLTLIMASGPLSIAIVFAVGSVVLTKYRMRWLRETAEAGTVAEEAFSSIQTVVGLNAQSQLSIRFDGFLAKAERWAARARVVSGILLGAIFTIIYMAIGLGFWMGSRYLVKGTVSYIDILAIILAMVTGIVCLGGIIPPLQVFAVATAAGSRLYGTIDRNTPGPFNRSSEKVAKAIAGHIELKNVRHVYPSRPDVAVLDSMSFTIEPRKTTAIVGASGSGKSTIVELLERFYDPLAGEILLDGCKLSDLNLKWLRQNMSLVQQSPTLFDTTIFENIRYGLVNTPHESASDEVLEHLVHDACRTANAHDFISKLPSGYQTHVGEAGSMLSGGQKQRICIARALVRNPQILLLDEATSALDSTSEAIVQAAIEKASKGRTTLVVAHRLSTVKSADKIIVLSGGRLVEQGTHNELLAMDGTYAKLAMTQRVNSDQGNLPREVESSRVTHHERKLDSVDNESAFPPKVEKHASYTLRADTNALETLEHPGKDYSMGSLLKFVLHLHKNSKPSVLHGMLWSIQAGAGAPIQAIFLAKCLTTLARPPSEYALLRSEINLWAGMHVVLAFVQLLAYTGQSFTLGASTERLIRHVSGSIFRAILDKDMTFFDMSEHGVGALVSFISNEPSSIAGMGCYSIGQYIMAFTTLIGAVATSIAVGWKLGLVGSATVPILLVCGLLRYRVMGQLEARLRKSYQEAASLAGEAISSIRTVASLNLEHNISASFHDQLAQQDLRSIRTSLTSSALFAFSQSASMLCTALGLWYGGTLVISGEYGLFQFILSFAAINICGDVAGSIFSSSPDLAKAKQSTTRLKALLEGKPQEHVDCVAARPLLEGNVEFRDTHFRYPSRPERHILNGFNLTIQKGKYVALVGSSGCGKSTIVALLEQFYRPITGVVAIDGMDISSLDITAYRDQVALVDQEPRLFQGTIRENLVLGLNRPDCSQQELERACEDAYILDFIASLPLGFDTMCGGKGNNFSGGQKQRIAIARALLRQPKVLLLDEVTSALDSESQRAVQSALDKAAKGRTIIAIAHRLSAIQNADLICFLEHGVVVESGTHAELLRKRGKYFTMSNLQSLEG